MSRTFYIIEGSGLAYSLAKKLLLLGNRVFYVSDKKSNLEILDGLKINFSSLELIHQDPTDICWIENLDLDRKVEAMIIISEDDALNFVVSWLLKQFFKEIKVIALVNSPEDEIMFQSIEVETIVPIRWMEKLIESSLIYEDVTDFFNPYVDKLSILEISIESKDKANCKKLKDVNLPQNSIIGVLIRKNGEILVPHGETVILSGDKLIVLSLKDKVDEVVNALK